jgi:hypothetical protein
MENCRTIVMTDDALWEPKNVSIAQVKNEQRTYADKLSSISDVFSDTELMSRMVSAVRINTIKCEPLTNSLSEKQTSDDDHQMVNTINNILFLVAKN